MARRTKGTFGNNIVSRKKLPPVVYGLEGIMGIFNISKSTAWRYRHSVIKDACTQNGNIIVVDVKKALSLFGLENPDSLVTGQEPVGNSTGIASNPDKL